MYEIVIIGSGPGGLSAAARCAECDIHHVLLEGSGHLASTISGYQKGKYVMAEPEILPLRASIAFEAGTREAILEAWQASVTELGVNIRFHAEVGNIKRSHEGFGVVLASGEVLLAKHIVLAIGVQGNPRRMELPAEPAPIVQYSLDDPAEIVGEKIAVIGAGDSAIENAIALANQNDVSIVNRRSEFARAKDGNLALVTAGLEAGTLTCYFDSVPKAIHLDKDANPIGLLDLDSAQGVQQIEVDRVIARLGAVPPRALVESFGIEFPGDDPSAVPVLSSTYESNVPGIFILGSLAGYPLIKQALNQGYEVVEHILGRTVQPADHEVLAEKFARLPFALGVDELLALMQERISIFAGINALQFRELILGSELHAPKVGDTIFSKNDYSNSFYTILAGDVVIEAGAGLTINAGVGDFFGEMSLISGRRRSATVVAGAGCVLIETPRRLMNKVITSVGSVKRTLDETFILRTIQQRFAPSAAVNDLQKVSAQAVLNQFSAGEIIFSEGEPGETLHFIRSGSVTVSNWVEGKEVIVSYVPANSVVGEMALLGGTTRTASVRAAVKTETISLSRQAFSLLAAVSPDLEASLGKVMKERRQQNVKSQSASDTSGVLSFLMGQGMGEATDLLLIDETLCVGCDLCEQACAATHGGVSRLDREAGASYADIHVPTSCRHCEDPSCMKDCPPDAIKRNGVGGEVYISDNCIGCGNCEANCPYDVIQMAYPTASNDGFWSWSLFGVGGGPGSGKELSQDVSAIKQAVKCDMCIDLKGGAACVNACPTGAATRVNPVQFQSLFLGD